MIEGQMGKELTGFDEFWSVYPKKTGIDAAMSAYRSALKKITHSTLVRTTMHYRDSCQSGDTSRIKNAANWLNEEGWRQYLAARPSSNSPSQVYVSFTERDEWDRYGRKIGKSYPRDSRGGWWFPSRRPPSEGPHDAAADEHSGHVG